MNICWSLSDNNNNNNYDNFVFRGLDLRPIMRVLEVAYVSQSLDGQKAS